MEQIASMLWEIISSQTDENERNWLKSQDGAKVLDIMTAFVAAPRHVARKQIFPTDSQIKFLSENLPGFSVEGWSLVRLVRVWLLTRIRNEGREKYVGNIQTLFDTAEMNELVALYSALPLLHYPETWLARATDAVRSNIGSVLDAIALKNPYPAAYFSEGAWNQMVMKSIFNNKPVYLIDRLEERSNADLARMVTDLAHERWTAGRSIAPEVWVLIVKFLNDSSLADLKLLLDSTDASNKQAAALVALHSGFQPAMQLLEEYPETHALAMSGKLTWKILEHTNQETHVS